MSFRTRGLAVAVAVAMTAGLSACSLSAQDDGALHVLIAANTAHAEDQRAWMGHIQREFKKKTGAEVVFDTFASAGDEQTKIQTSMISGTGPDVYGIGTTYTPVAYATGGYRELSDADWARIGGRDKFLPTSLTMSGPNAKKNIGVPTVVRPYGMVYNTEMFAAAGIDGPPTTWDEFLADAKKLTNKSAGVYGAAIDYADGYNPWKYIWTLAEQSGAPLVSKDLEDANLNNPVVAKAVRDYFDLSTSAGVVDPASAGWKNSQATAAFAAGKAAIMPMVTPQVRFTLDTSSVKGKFAFAPLPLVPFGASQRPANGVAAGSIISGDNLAIATYTKKVDLALDYIALVTSIPEQLYAYKVFGDIPSVTTAADQIASTDADAAAFVAAEKLSVPTAFTGAWGDVQLGLTNVVTQSLPGLAAGSYNPNDIKKLLSTANKTVQGSLKRQER